MSDAAQLKPTDEALITAYGEAALAYAECKNEQTDLEFYTTGVALRARLAELRAGQVPTPPPGKHYELVPDGETLSEITEQWGAAMRSVMNLTVDLAVAKRRAEAAEKALADCRAALLAIQGAVNTQAEDEGLWFVAQYASEALLQQGLRDLHAAIEGVMPRALAKEAPRHE